MGISEWHDHPGRGQRHWTHLLRYRSPAPCAHGYRLDQEIGVIMLIARWRSPVVLHYGMITLRMRH
eukprot:2964555-Amphidinium_carterae.1